MSEPYERAHLDIARYEASTQQSPCFICRVIDGTHEYEQPIIYRDDVAIAFLSRYPTLVGYVLVSPLQHRENVVDDFTAEEYLRLQSVVYEVGRAISATFPTERLYVLSLGSKQGNSHVHWHLAPLPPGVPYGEQQFHALMVESKGYLAVPDVEQARLAAAIAGAMSPVQKGPSPLRRPVDADESEQCLQGERGSSKELRG